MYSYHCNPQFTFQKEGFKGQVKPLFHRTSLEDARYTIANGGKMRRGEKGMLGGGIYFAEFQDMTETKAHYSGAMIETNVTIELCSVK